MTRKKAAQKDDINTNLQKKNVDFFAKYTGDDINHSIRSSKFPNELKQAVILVAHKNSPSFLRKIIDLSVSSQMFLRFMKGARTIKQQHILNISFLDINEVLARVIVLNNVC